jgi:hypothetical protein
MLRKAILTFVFSGMVLACGDEGAPATPAGSDLGAAGSEGSDNGEDDVAAGDDASDDEAAATAISLASCGVCLAGDDTSTCSVDETSIVGSESCQMQLNDPQTEDLSTWPDPLVMRIRSDSTSESTAVCLTDQACGDGFEWFVVDEEERIIELCPSACERARVADARVSVSYSFCGLSCF